MSPLCSRKSKVSAKDEFEFKFEFKFTMHIIPSVPFPNPHTDVLTYLRSAQRHNRAGYIIKMIMIHRSSLVNPNVSISVEKVYSHNSPTPLQSGVTDRPMMSSRTAPADVATSG
ncbi:hypothetical protein PENNAL_c0092G02582 [Penicillium nalgiovense]|uniref:Uncharacterized protein n=1 Tax=Penicillium nalgiovense TaxID=60175 RepID=A0A1V6XC32_PENNA|nr:hypothetical protein PENNAL_c0092G02582 [Penicillium nalgiovense]